MSVRPSPFDAEEKTDPGLVARGARPSLVPWGLFCLLGVYACAATGLSVWHLWSSDDYQAARHYRRAQALLGPDGGRSASRATLAEAYSDLLEAARRVPQVRDFHEQLESLNWRFDEKHWAIPGDLRERADAVATIYTRIQEEQQPLLVVGARDRGWEPDQLLQEPKRLLWWALLGALGVVAVWTYFRLGARAREASERAERQVELEREVAEIGRERQRATRIGPR